MSKLIAQLETAFANLAQEAHKDASVLVQFAAGDWAKLKEAFVAEKDTIVAGMTSDAATAHADLVAANEQLREALADAEATIAQLHEQLAAKIPTPTATDAPAAETTEE